MDRTGADPLLPADPPNIGPYRLLGRIGQGGMGTVYLAEAPTGRPVAVKVVKAEFTVDEGFAVRFHAEVTNARRVASFCTAEVLDNGNADDGRPYMVTEYIAGTPLSKQISRFGALEAGTLHGVALGVAAALAAIHVAGLVHRDLKPANVILSMSGPRVIDFGIARALDATQGVTRSGELLGSPGWWAPEQVRGEEISPAADVFAWGCLVAYAGNGRHPYGRGDLMTLASRVLAGRPDLGTLPAPLDRLVRQATDPDPRRRPSAQELLIALVGGDPTGATPPPAAARVVPVDPPTLVATEMLNESWEPPANVAAAEEAQRAEGVEGVEGAHGSYSSYSSHGSHGSHGATGPSAGVPFVPATPVAGTPSAASTAAADVPSGPSAPATTSGPSGPFTPVKPAGPSTPAMPAGPFMSATPSGPSGAAGGGTSSGLAAEGIGDTDDTNPGLSLPGLALPRHLSARPAPGAAGPSVPGRTATSAPGAATPSGPGAATSAISGTTGPLTPATATSAGPETAALSASGAAASAVPGTAAPSGPGGATTSGPGGAASAEALSSAGRGLAAASQAPTAAEFRTDTAIDPGAFPAESATAAAGTRTEDTRPSAGADGVTVPSSIPATGGEPRRRSLGRRWLVPALTVLGGLLVTAGVLVMVLPDRTPVRATGVAAVTAPTPTRETDVGRRYAASETLDGPQFVIPSRPQCGLTSYQGATPDEGRFCVVRWTLINPGGVPAAVSATPPVLVDDRGAEHEPLTTGAASSGSPAVPATLPPGGRLDGVLVYDLPPARGPATLKVPISDTTTIEVRL
ncbi:protein kinase [Sphaerisporangium sp. NPDC005289]|uniref:protein kinase domain-containing protein n=1 Tax=Sphaerisporangium sp. NPDC005289 TaxID=3155247 RepID=UPI0033B30319